MFLLVENYQIDCFTWSSGIEWEFLNNLDAYLLGFSIECLACSFLILMPALDCYLVTSIEQCLVFFSLLPVTHAGDL